jgi:superfamily II DNA helicase RecQ
MADSFETKARRLLKAKFGFDSFRPGQLEAIRSVYCDRKDTLLVVPTGTGKSLVYQLLGCLLPGIVLVVTPTVDLMNDQCAELRKWIASIVDCDYKVAVLNQTSDRSLIDSALAGQGKFGSLVLTSTRSDQCCVCTCSHYGRREGA